jgi:hypothetical protein
VYTPIVAFLAFWGWVIGVDNYRGYQARSLCAGVRPGEPMAAIIARGASENGRQPHPVFEDARGRIEYRLSGEPFNAYLFSFKYMSSHKCLVHFEGVHATSAHMQGHHRVP